MDDWSLLPSRNAVSEPAPNHQSPLNPTALNPDARLDPPRQAPPAGAENPCPQAERLTRQAEPGNPAMKSGAEPRNPFTTERSRRSPHANRTRTHKPQPPLDNTRPFMDDTGRPLKRPRDARPSDCRCRTNPATPGPSRRAVGSAQLAGGRAACRAAGGAMRGQASACSAPRWWRGDHLFGRGRIAVWRCLGCRTNPSDV